jgi:hypothetical protein
LHANTNHVPVSGDTGEPRTTIDIDVNVFAAPTVAKDIVGPRVTGVLAHYLGPDDEAIRQLDDIGQEIDKEAKER